MGRAQERPLVTPLEPLAGWPSVCPRCGGSAWDVLQVSIREAGGLMAPGRADWPAMPFGGGFIEAITWTELARFDGHPAVACRRCRAVVGTMWQWLVRAHPDPAPWQRHTHGLLMAVVGHGVASASLRLDASEFDGRMDFTWIEIGHRPLAEAVRSWQSSLLCSPTRGFWQQCFDAHACSQVLGTWFLTDGPDTDGLYVDAGLLAAITVWGLDGSDHP